jgi:CRP-like cAMP-binding protein
MLTPTSMAPTVGILESVKLALEGLGALVAPLLVYGLGVRGALICVGLPLMLLVPLMWTRIHAADSVGLGRSRSVRLLHQVPLFHVADMSLLEDIASRVTHEHYRSGDEIIREGDVGDRFYVVEEGTAQVSMSGYAIGDMGPGSSFGDKALLRNARRAATVVALSDLSLVTLSRDDFLATVNGNDRGEEVTGDWATISPRNPADVAAWNDKTLAEVFRRLALFSQLSTRTLLDVARAAHVMTWPGGSDLTVQGTAGNEFHVILDGRTQVLVDGRLVGELLPGDAFGEIALLHDVPRVATVTAMTPVTTCTLTKEQFVGCVRESRDVEQASDLLT